jgi:predicted outer membrane repeat protein
MYGRLQRLPRHTRRQLECKFAFGLAGAALMLALSRAPVHGAAINVANGEVAIAANGICSLVEAIENADDTSNGQPHLDCAAGNPNGQDRINLPDNGAFYLKATYGNYFGSDTGLPQMDTRIIVEGHGSTIARDPYASEFRLLAIGSNSDVTLNDLHMRTGYAKNGGAIYNGGELEMNFGSLYSNVALEDGGALFNAGTATLNNALLSGNLASGVGGGVYNNGTITFDQSIVRLNRAANGGGAYNENFEAIGIMNVTESQFTNNYAANMGGALYTHLGDLTILNSTIAYNAATRLGGGIRQESGHTLVINSTLSGNTAAIGGAADNYIAYMGFINSTVTGNVASYEGGGLHNDSAGNMALVRTLVSGNNAPVGREIHNCGSSNSCYYGEGNLTADNFNLFGHEKDAGLLGLTPGPTDIVPTMSLGKILDLALADNGGPTPTHALKPKSPALDVAPSSDCTTAPVNGLDQRGEKRNVDGNGKPSNKECDTGAFERQ